MSSKLYANQGSTDIKLMKDGYLAGGFFIVNHCKLFKEPPSKRLEDFGFILDQDNKYVKGSSLSKTFGKTISQKQGRGGRHRYEIRVSVRVSRCRQWVVQTRRTYKTCAGQQG